MRLFDLFGAIAVIAWLALVGTYVYEVNFGQVAADELSSEVVIYEGESWIMLTRNDESVGFLHETRTPLDDGWLLEYDLMINVSMLGVGRVLETKIKASVNNDARLRDFSGEIDTSGTRFEVQGRVEGLDVIMNYDLGGGFEERRIRLNEAPRLSNSAFYQLAAQGDLKPGDRLKQEYFDPTVMGMTTMEFEFVREHTQNVLGVQREGFHFKQHVAGNTFDVYVDKKGEVYIQELPLRILGARVESSYGRSRAQALRRAAREGAGSGVDLSVDEALGLLQRGDPTSIGNTTKFQIDNIPAIEAVELESGAQAVTSKGESAVVDTSVTGERAELTEENRALMLAESPAVDHGNPAFEEFLKAVADIPKEAPPERFAERIGRSVKASLTPEVEIGVQSASAALEGGQGDCTEYALVLVAALRRAKIPSRFVLGLRFGDDGKPVPHQWVQYAGGDGRFVDLDPTTDTLIPGTGQIQLMTSPDPTPLEFTTILGAIKIEPIAAENPKADFN